MKKRLLASILVFSMLASMMPMSALAAKYTAEEAPATNTQQTEAYSEEVAPDAVAPEDETSTSGDATVGDDTDAANDAVTNEQPTAGGAPIGIGAEALAQTGTLASGAYILKNALKGDLVIPDGAHVILDLNGHTLTGSGMDSVITNHGTLIITDNSGTGKGAITGGTGKVLDNTLTVGGGIFNEGILRLLNGNIQGNTASGGGGVFNAGVFCMEGGRLTKNVATVEGGGLSTRRDYKMTFLFKGGSIDHNDAWGAGAIHVAGANSMVQMTGPARIYSNTLHPDDENHVRGNGTDLYYAVDQKPSGEEVPPYLDMASPVTWGIIGMHSWYKDSANRHYPEYITEVPNGEVDNMVTVGKANTVTFDTDGGYWWDGTTADKDVQLWVDETKKPTKYFSIDDGNDAVPQDPEKSGYTFKGWYTAPNGQGTVLDTAVAVTKDITYYAAWEDNSTQEYTLTYQPNGGSYVPATIHKDGESVTLNAKPTREGYEFVGWCADEALTQPIQSVTMDSDKTVYAAWRETKLPSQYVTVTFDANDGQWSNGDTTKSVKILRGSAIFESQFPEKDPSRAGNVFKGWYTDKTNGAKFTPYTIVDKDTTVYAQWTKNYLLTYETNGGQMTGDTVKDYPPGKTVTLNQSVKKDGYVFKGWYATPNFSGSPIERVTMESNKTVYAKWAKQYRLTYHTADGTIEGPNEQLHEEGDVVTLTTKITKPGYQFAGWYATSDYSGSVLTEVTMDENKDVYAKWVNKPAEQVHITYKFSGDVPQGIIPPEVEKVEKGKEYTPYQYSSDAIPEGWGFKGWFTSSYFSEWNRFTGGVVDKDLTLYGGWYKVANTVLFDANGGQWDGKQTSQKRSVEKGEALRPYKEGDVASDCMPVNPEREGYTFIGWNTEKDGSGEAFYEEIPVNKDITVYAQWEAGEWVHVRYKWFEPSGPDESLPVPSDVQLPSVAKIKKAEFYNAEPAPHTNEPYWIFEGWFEDEECTIPYKSRSLKDDLTLYGKWERDYEFAVTYRLPTPETVYEQTHMNDINDVFVPVLGLQRCATGWNDAFENNEHEDEINAYLKDKIIVGWKDVATGKIYPEEAFIDISFPIPKGGYTFEAVLETISSGEYVLTYDYNHDIGENILKETHAAGEQVTLRDTKGFERPGYEFLGWSTKDSDKLMKPGETYIMPAQNVKLYGEWKYTGDLSLVFETYGGTPVPEPYTVLGKDLVQMAESENPDYKFKDDGGHAVTFDDPDLEGFQFVGWLADISEAVAATDDGAVGAELQAYIDMRKSMIKLIRDKIASGNYTGAELLELKKDLLEWQCGSEFIALPDDHNPNVVNYHQDRLESLIGEVDDRLFETEFLANRPGDRDSIIEDVYNVSIANQIPAIEELRMKALYVDKNGDLAFATDVTYDSNNGSGEKVVKEYIETATVPLLNNNPFKNQSKELLGWNTKPDGNGKSYKLGAEFKVPVGGTTLYAQWKQDVPVQKYTVSYDLAGGNGADGETYDAVEVVKDSVVKAKKAPTKDGFIFKGWSDGKTTYQPGDDITVTGNVTLTAQWEKKAEPKPTFTVSYDLAGGTGSDGVNYDSVSVTEGDKVTAKKAPTKDGFTFKGWSDGKNIYQPGDAISVSGNITLTAQWEKNSAGGGGGSVTKYYVLSYDSNGGTAYKDEKYRKNTVVDLDKVPIRTGYTFTGWYADKGLTDKITSIKMTDDKTVYAGWKGNYIPDDLNSKDHVAYVVGYVDGTVKPNNDVTRAETAAMLYRLLTDERRAEIDTSMNPFSDVKPSDWYAQPVFSMANGQYIAGYEDGTFGGNQSITRAEFVAMLVRFIGAEKAECEFTDVPKNYWAYDDIATATVAGWIGGYPDGSFGPNKKISRAEAMSIINRVLDRGVDADSELLDFKKWPDNPKDSWCYYEVIEATNEHEYTGSRPSEDWTSLSID